MAYSDKQNFQENSQLVDNKKFMDSTGRDITMFLSDVLHSYETHRQLDSPYYGFTSLTDKWTEYERCYEVRAKSREKKGPHEYKGWSDTVFPDFHDKIETLRTREVNALFAGADTFEVRTAKPSKEDATRLARLLVKQNFNCIDSLREQVSLIEKDKLLLGTWHAYVPYVEDETIENEMINYLVGDDGKPVLVNGKTVPSDNPYEVEMKSVKKYTNLMHLSTCDVYVNPAIRDIQKQEAVAIHIRKSYQELLDMEDAELLGKGMADEIREQNPGTESADGELQERQDAISNETGDLENKTNIFDIYLIYFKYKEPGKKKRCIYEAICDRQGQLFGCHKYFNSTYPILKGCHILGNAYYGTGVGDEIYPVYSLKNTRTNQITDKSNFEIKGGGLKDAKVPDFTDIAPGEYKNINGLSAQLQAGGKPVLLLQELLGDAKSVIGYDLLAVANEAMQNGSGATSLLGGRPTDSDIDKTLGGIQIAVTQANERINTYLEDFENDLFKAFAKLSFKNYKKFIDDEDLEQMFDIEELVTTDSQGKEIFLSLDNINTDIDFIFTGAKRIVESEKRIGKFLRFLSIMGQVYAVHPQLGELMIRAMDFKFFMESIARDLDIADLDKMFPQMNLPQLLTDAQVENQALQQENQVLKEGVARSKQALSDSGNASALQTVNQVQEQLIQEVTDAAGQTGQ